MEDWYFAFCMAKLICLIVIAMSVYHIAYGEPEYLVGKNGLMGAGPVSSATNPRYAQVPEQSMFIGNGNEPPVFWNSGSFADVNESQQTSIGAEGKDMNVSHMAGKLDENSLVGSLNGL